MTDGDARARLVRDVIAALERFADRLADADAPDEAVAPRNPPRPADEHALGRRQLQIVELPGMADEDGMKTSQIAAAIGYELPNTYSTLQALVRNQIVEQVRGSDPQRWRLARRYRRTAHAFARAADLVRAGEWTTAGDVSIAVRGDTRAADAIGRSRLSHRIVTDDAVPPEVRGRLEAEGVAFGDDGRPDPRRRISWDELGRRAAAAAERRNVMANGTLNYLQVPAADLDRSATFYEDVFGWRITRQPSVAMTDLEPQTGYVGFVDGSGNVGGEFVLGRPPSREPGLLPSIHVDSIDASLAAIVAAGGEVVLPRTPIVDSSDWQAIFRDPAGNAFALYEAA